VLKFKKQGGNWWFDFTFQVLPTFILDRNDILNSKFTADGGTALTDQQVQWFDAHYELIKAFHYKDYLVENENLFSPIYRLSSHSSYYLYKKRKLINKRL
jgi:hypothetical protein